MKKLLFTGLSLCLVCCASVAVKSKAEAGVASSEVSARKTNGIPYQFDTPDATMELPGKLEEISGLSVDASGKYLVAVQDENGIVFFLDRKSGRIEREFEFWKDGDYEGVEVVGEEIFVIKSSGTVYRITDPGTAGQQVDKFNFGLDKDDDVEGLGYEPAHHRLLLACKGKGETESGTSHQKGIYGFDLRTMMLSGTPVYTVALDAVKRYLAAAPDIRKLETIETFFTTEDDKMAFSPSGIAIHPFTGDLYLTSSVGKLLLVMDRRGEILHIEKLRKKELPQPEGICFDRQGNLYISTEGKDGPARVLRYDYRPAAGR